MVAFTVLKTHFMCQADPCAALTRLPSILLVDADDGFRRHAAEFLSGSGYAVSVTSTGTTGLHSALAEPWKGFVLAVTLPDINGLEVLRRIRRVSNVPVLLLTTQSNEVDEITGLEGGADDYLLKQSSSRRLLARLQAAIRRAPDDAQAPRPNPPEIQVNGLRILSTERRVFLHHRVLALTSAEFDLLLVLAKKKGQVKTRVELFSELYARVYGIFDRVLDVHISALRRKLGDDLKCPRFIRTVHSRGYMLIDLN